MLGVGSGCADGFFVFTLGTQAKGTAPSILGEGQEHTDLWNISSSFSLSVVGDTFSQLIH